MHKSYWNRYDYGKFEQLLQSGIKESATSVVSVHLAQFTPTYTSGKSPCFIEFVTKTKF